ncbi:flagellar assembly protein FliH [Nitrosomonas sp. PY1]|uniref:flagellar assembly protein FliH n=1 Tax=Nitrosomonas sp. PY1 TaxID=1803906 RepID=UPI001FC8221C|nr:flagellar assembly protein FliH [Nitrosomonas sp. PY1]GKS68049.1 flagellar assembly protein FliH [Nitrosomonas sp. PY1]
MTDGFVPKEQLSSYQRWEMSAFDDADVSSEALNETQSESPESNDSINNPTVVPLSTEVELTAIHNQAKEEGYAAGFQEGSAAGYTEGRNTAELEVKEEVLHLQTLLSNFTQDLYAMQQHIANDLLAMAITTSKKMTAQALEIKPELIIPIVQAAIQQLPYSVQHPRLFLHPDDAKIVHAHLSDQLTQENWSIREDGELTRGGCRIVTNGSEIDATIESRWQKILSAIGQQNDWLE